MNESMIFAADIGNSSISVGIYTPEGALALSFKLSCDRAKSEDEYAVMLKNIFDIYAFDLKLVRHAIIASVVPSLTFVISVAVQKLFKGTKPLVVGPGIKTSLDIKVDHPSELGADIVANAVAAIKRFPAPIAIVDLGTATTLTVINAKKQLTDVFIYPGVQSSLRAVSHDAAELPQIALSEPKAFAGKNTAVSMNAGILYANAFAVDGFIKKIKTTYQIENLSVVATGGMAELVAPICETPVTVRKHLTLKGLYYIYIKNSTN
ncbi:MAG: type III pantothenate kinase [Clostridiales bacterium]|nr:type III pantothenate kinase [Clostridiales bacterium]